MYSRRSIIKLATLSICSITSGCLGSTGDKEDDIEICNKRTEEISGKIIVTREQTQSKVLDEKFMISANSISSPTTDLEPAPCEKFGEPIDYGGIHIIELSMDYGETATEEWDVPANEDGTHAESEFMRIDIQEGDIVFNRLHSTLD